MLFLTSMAGCSGQPHLTVGEVAFDESDVRGLSEPQVERLIQLTSLGLATAHGEIERLGAGVVEEWARERRIERLRQEAALQRAGVDDLVLQARYEMQPDYELTVRHLVILSERFESEAERAEARTRAEAALERARSGESFPDLAGEVSEEPGAAERGGLLEPGREGTWVREFWEAASALDEGEISPVVESPYGFHVLKLEERSPLPFSESRHRIAERIGEQVADSEAWADQVEAWAGAGSAAALADPEHEAHERVRDRLLEEADAQAITLSEAQRAELVRRWEALASRWAATLGFTQDVSTDDVAVRAREALGATGQNAGIVRDEIARWGEEIASAYPVERAGD